MGWLRFRNVQALMSDMIFKCLLCIKKGIDVLKFEGGVSDIVS